MDLAGILLDRVSEAVTVTRGDGALVQMNAAANRLFGPERDRVVGGPAPLLAADADAQRATSVDQVLDLSGSWRGRLVRTLRDDGELVTAARIETIAIDGHDYRLWFEAAAETPTDAVPGPSPREATLSDAEARLALAIKAGRMAVWDFDNAADHVTGSPELNRLLGFPADAEPTTDEIRTRYYPGERERLQAAGQAALAHGERFVESEFRYLWPDGSVRWVLLRAQAMLDADGRPARALGIAMDITDRKNAEDALRASETRLRLAQNAAGIGVWDWNVAAGTATWSPEVYRILDVDPSGAAPTNETWLEAIHPDDRSAAAAAVRRTLDDGEPFSIEYRLAKRGREDGRWVRSSGAPVGSEGDVRPARVVGVNVDVTEQRLREESLLHRAADFETAAQAARRERDRIYDLSNDVFAAIGVDGRLVSVNAAWHRLFGGSAPGVEAIALLDLVHPDERDVVAAVLSEIRPGISLQRFECRLLRPDASDVWIAWAAMLEGNLIYAIGRDVTIDREREAALRQAQKMEALGQLTGGIAHDFNNLLQAIGGYLELILNKPGEVGRIDTWARNAFMAAERGTKLTAQLLTFSRSQQIAVGAVAISHVVRQMHDLLERTLGPTIRISLDLAGDEIGVIADRNQLEVALLNLAINARDAMPEGGALTISTVPLTLVGDIELPAGDYVEVRVVDTGVGMASGIAARAFDPFFTTKGVGKGTGLGLSQVYGMARQAGGTARVDSRPGRGTVVSLLLRRSDPPAEPETDAPISRGSSATPSVVVLVVDDDAHVRRLLSDMLAALGYAVVTAESGAEGLAEIDRLSPDLLLLDFAMPHMDGAEVAKIVKRTRPDLPIVFASGHADTALIDAVAGPTSLRLRKPFRMDELAAVLQKARASQASGQVSSSRPPFPPRARSDA